MAANRAPVALRLYRLARLALHLFRGLAIAALLFPRMPESARRREMLRWSRKLLSILSVTLREEGVPERLPQRCMLALNHISWIDIFVIDARFPATFIAKSEVRAWPLVGWLSTLVGTLYIERGKRSAARHARQAIVAELERGTLVAVCPEGTTTFGRSLEPFHAALFQPAIDAGATVQPVALRYLDPAGRHTDAAGYVGETSLLASVWTIVSTRRMVARLSFLAQLPAGDQTRRALAEMAEAAIAESLDVPAPHSAAPGARKAPGTRDGPAAELR